MARNQVDRPEEREIQQRFFDAFSTLGMPLSRFAEEANVHRQKYVAMRQKYIKGEIDNQHAIDATALAYICRHYGINAEWLLLGKGTMFKRNAN